MPICDKAFSVGGRECKILLGFPVCAREGSEVSDRSESRELRDALLAGTELPYRTHPVYGLDCRIEFCKSRALTERISLQLSNGNIEGFAIEPFTCYHRNQSLGKF